MDSRQLHKFIVIGIGLIAAFASYITLEGIDDVYHASVSFFEGQTNYYPWLFTAIVASVPFVLFLITYYVHKNKKPIIVSLLTIYSLLVYLSYPTMVLVLLIVAWWFITYPANTTPNKTLKQTD